MSYTSEYANNELSKSTGRGGFGSGAAKTIKKKIVQKKNVAQEAKVIAKGAAKRGVSRLAKKAGEEKIKQKIKKAATPATGRGLTHSNPFLSSDSNIGTRKQMFKGKYNK
jgi:hypothetical protein